MKKVIAFSLLFLAVSVYGKRMGPKRVPAILYQGKKYVVKHWGKQTRFNQNGGIVEVWDIKSKKILTTILIYKVNYDSTQEQDVQDVFIVSMKLDKKNNAILLKNEDGFQYSLNLVDYAVTKIK